MAEACNWPRCKDEGEARESTYGLAYCRKHFEAVVNLRNWFWHETKRQEEKLSHA